MPIIENVIDQHAESASFEWLIRNGAVGQPHYNLSDLALLDESLSAHIDGLRIAGPDGWRICRQAIKRGQPGEVFVGGVLAFETVMPERMDAVLKAVQDDDKLKRALISALGWIDFDTIAEPVGKMLFADNALNKYIGLAAHAVHRRDPGAILAKLMEDQDPLVRARALKAAGELKRLDLLPEVVSHIQEEKEDGCRFYAAWSATLLGDGAAIDLLASMAAGQGAHTWDACNLYLRKTAYAGAVKWLEDLFRRSESRQTAMRGFGVLGAPQTVALLIDAMSHPELSRTAGEAFSMITGVDISYEDLDVDPPEEFEDGPCEDPQEDNVDLDLDMNLPRPSQALIAQWWDKNSHNFKAATRYLCGKPISPQQCKQVLIDGYQRQRISAALELSLTTPGQPLFEVRCPGYVQQRLLGEL